MSGDVKKEMKKLPLNPKKEIFHWGPVPMRIFYIADFLKGIFSKDFFMKSYPGYSWPNGLALSKNNRFVFVNEFPELRARGAKVFIDLMIPVSVRQRIYKNWKRDLKKLEGLEKRVAAGSLALLSEGRFFKLWRDFHLATTIFWRHVTVPELANYGSLEILEDKLKPFVSEEVTLAQAMETLTAPEQLSFYQQEEIDLSETKDLKSHREKYFWLKNSYASVETLPESFFAERKRKLPKYTRERVMSERQKTKDRKAKIISKLGLSSEVVDIAATIVAGIEWQDERKRDIWVYLHYKECLLNELVRRSGLPKEDLLNFREVELETFFAERTIRNHIAERKIFVGFSCVGGFVRTLEGESVDRYWNIYAEEKVSGRVMEFRGTVASAGTAPLVLGKVRILPDPRQSHLLREGEILVTSMTTPEYVFAMKKAAAIITDAGGLTSHAAVTSRELGKPCIVGTKVATKVLKDGDTVEVRTDTGIVKVLTL